MRALIGGFALGVGWLQTQSALPDARLLWNAGAVAGALIVAAALTAGLRRRSDGALTRWRMVLAALLLLAAGIGCGFIYAGVRASDRMSDELPAQWEGADIQVIGLVSGLPAINQADRSVRFAFDVERIVTDGALVPARVSLSWFTAWRGARSQADPPPLPEVHAGERWRLTVKLRRPHGNANPHGFDIEAWMLENGLRASGYVRAHDGNQRLDALPGRFIDHVDALRERIRARILRALDGRPYAGVIVALTVGDQRSVPQDQWQLYNRTGVSHLLSISGLHVTLFATIIGGALYWLWRRSQRLTTLLPARKAAALLGALAAFGYVLLAGFEVPAQRTLYMLSVAAAGLWIGRPGTAFNVLAWALLAVLLLDPWAVLAAGFWLSFGAVALLMYIGVGRLPASGKQDWREWLGAAGGAQWAITLGMVPMMLALFQQVSLVSPLANAFAIPLVSMVVVPMALASLVVPWDGLLVAAHALFALVALALEWLGALPSAVWTQHAPPSWAIVMGIAGALLLLAPRGLHVRLLGVAWLLPLFIVLPLRPPPGAVWFEVLDVGQGLAVVVQTHRHALLYDTGARFTDQADAGNRIIAPYLRAQGIARLDAMVVTHADADHSGGAMSLLEIVPVGSLLSSLPEDNRIVARRRAAGAMVERCEAGQQWSWDGVHFQVMHPPVESYADARIKTNDRGCVIKITSIFGSALLTADIESRSESELIRRDPQLLPSEVLLVPHHGSKTSSTAAFIDAVKPQLAIATPGYRNRFGHPRAEVLARYREREIPFLRSDFDGAIEVRFEGGAPKVRRWRSSGDGPYWRDRPLREQAPLE